MATEEAAAPAKPSELSKKEKNRLAARKCRAKKKLEESELMKKLRDTRSRLSQLRYEVYQLEERRESLLQFSDDRKRACRPTPVADAAVAAEVAATATDGVGGENFASAVYQLLSDGDTRSDVCDANTTVAAVDSARGRTGDNVDAGHYGMLTSQFAVATAAAVVATSSADSFIVSSGVDGGGCASFAGLTGSPWTVAENYVDFDDTFGLCEI